MDLSIFDNENITSTEARKVIIGLGESLPITYKTLLHMFILKLDDNQILEVYKVSRGIIKDLNSKSIDDCAIVLRQYNIPDNIIEYIIKQVVSQSLE